MSDHVNNISQEEIKKFNHNQTDWWNLNGSLKTLHDINHARIDFISNIQKLDGLTILDVGCGGGILSEGLAKHRAKVTAIDLAENAINIAKNHAVQSQLNIDYRHQSIETLADQLPGHFDMVVCFEMLEHVPDPQAIITSCQKLLKPKGHLFLSTLNKTLKANLLGIFVAEKLLKIVPPGTHDFQKFISPFMLSQMCENSQLTVKKISGLTYNPMTRIASLSKDVSINYLLYAQNDSQE